MKYRFRPVRPNEGIAALYRRCLLKMIDRMHRQTIRLLKQQYVRTPPLAQDAKKPKPLPAKELSQRLNRLNVKWRKLFNEYAPKLARYFTIEVAKRTDANLKSNLKKGGLEIKFKLTQPQKDVIFATFKENVALIKSIPAKYHADVFGAVMRSVAAGGELKPLAKKLQTDYGLTKKRAHLIAKDQNSKAVAALTRQRNIELGIKEAIWKHSGHESHPRPTHKKNDGKRFNVVKGWLDPAVGQHIWPGQLINCRCVSIPVIPTLGG